MPPTPTLHPSPAATEGPGPKALSLVASRAETDEGEGIALAWEANGERITVCPLIGESPVSCRCLAELPPVGSTVIPPSQIIGAYSGFQLAVEARGIRTVRYAPLAVACPAEGPEWFFNQPPGFCPQDAPLRSYAAAQRFENGMMIWIEAVDDFYILFDHDRRITDPSQGWSSLTSLQILRGPLELLPGASVDNRVGETPPAGATEPVSGFGLIWRGEVVGTAGIREALGWGVEAEYGYETTTQCARVCGADWNCYLRGPEGRVLHVYSLLHFGHYWEVVGEAR
jgi:hypothetical protein